MSVIPEPTQIPPSTPPAPPLLATVTPVVLVPNSKAFTTILHIVSDLEKDVKELKQVDHTPSHEKHLAHKKLYDALIDSLLVNENDMDRLAMNPASRRKRWHDDKDQNPPTGSDQRMKNRRTRKDVEPSKKSLKSKESAKDVILKILKKDWFKKSPRPKTLDLDWNTIKTVNDALEQSWFNEMIQAEKSPLAFDELISTPIDFFAFSMNHLKLNKITRADLVGLLFNLLKGHKRSVDMCKKFRKTVLLFYYQDTSCKGPQCQLFNKDMINWKSKHEVFLTMRILSVVTDKVEKKSGCGYLEKIVVRRADQKLYKFKECGFYDLYLNDTKDMFLLIAQNKLFYLEGDVIMYVVIALKMFTQRIIVQNEIKDVQLGVESYQRKLNLTKPQRRCPHISVKEPYTLNFDPIGVIYEDKSKKIRIMLFNEIHNFCDGTLQSVRNILRKRLLNFKFVTTKACLRGSRQQRIRDAQAYC
nr:hypothetical protein [Tanacetum cinerariifolium]